MQIVESIREGKKVKQRVVASLGVVKDEQRQWQLLKLAENLIAKLQQQGLPIAPKVDLNKLVHTLTEYDGFATVIDKLMDLTKFSEVLREAQGRQKFSIEEVIKLIITQRVDLPSSKLRTHERQREHGFAGLDLQHLYRAMDAIELLGEKIQKQAFETARLLSDNVVDCFFFDVTTLYFESIQQDELKDFGFSKDQKYHSVQIVLALVVNNQGIPLAYEVFKGNVAETKTLIPVLTALRKRFSIHNVTVVCDRGLASRVNVEALQEAQFHFVIATKLRLISKTFKLNDLSTYEPLPGQENIPKTEQTLFRTLKHPQYEEALLISTYNPSRAVKDKEDRERLLNKLRQKLAAGSDETSIKKVISNGGYKKFMTVKNGSSIIVNESAVEEDAAWDGFHGIAVSNSANLTPREALARYRELWHVEEAFRIAKTSLRTRPIFHWTPGRIRSHVLICFMTLFLERYLEYLLQKHGEPLTPDKIRYALSQVHTMHFKNIETKEEGKMESTLPEDAKSIFRVLGIPSERKTALNQCSA
jgi:transposase